MARDGFLLVTQVMSGTVSHSGKAEYAGRVNHTRFTSRKPYGTCRQNRDFHRHHQPARERQNARD
jgi:hypothetical protein